MNPLAVSANTVPGESSLNSSFVNKVSGFFTQNKVYESCKESARAFYDEKLTKNNIALTSLFVAGLIFVGKYLFGNRPRTTITYDEINKKRRRINKKICKLFELNLKQSENPLFIKLRFTQSSLQALDKYSKLREYAISHMNKENRIKEKEISIGKDFASKPFDQKGYKTFKELDLQPKKGDEIFYQILYSIESRFKQKPIEN